MVEDRWVTKERFRQAFTRRPRPTNGTFGLVEPVGGGMRHRWRTTTSKGAIMATMRRWLAALCVASAFVIAGCGGSTPSPKAASPHLGVLLGVAGECSGLPGGPSHPVQVIVYRDNHVVVKQTKLGSHKFKFSLPAGQYRVTTNQSYVVPVNVTLQSGRVAHATVLSAACS